MLFEAIKLFHNEQCTVGSFEPCNWWFIYSYTK